jgi:hypothetical protein
MASSLQSYLTYTARLAFIFTAEGIDSLNALSATPAFASRVDYPALSHPKTSLLRSEDVYATESGYTVSAFEAGRVQAAQQQINLLQHSLINSGLVDNAITAALASMTTIMDIAMLPDEPTLHYARPVCIITGPHFDNYIARVVRTCSGTSCDVRGNIIHSRPWAAPPHLLPGVNGTIVTPHGDSSKSLMLAVCSAIIPGPFRPPGHAWVLVLAPKSEDTQAFNNRGKHPHKASKRMPWTASRSFPRS